MKSKLFLLLFFSYLIILKAQNLELIQVASGFDDPVDIRNAGDERLFIIEKDGRIRIIDEQGDLLTTPFLDITNKISITFNEQGLLGLAFHPDYQNNHFFFVNYTDNSGDTKIVRYKTSCDRNIADEDSEELILSIDQPYSNHNGGDLEFGPDGYLYIGTGDGGSGGDPQNFAQNTNSLLGKMLRLDVDNGAPWIPASNPFVNDNTTLDEIWATGLRNPWRYSFDRETGDLWIGDVGQGAKEEITFQPANSVGGENYGWRCREGFVSYDDSGCGPATDYVDPVHDFSHSGGACSVTGGFVYRGVQLPELFGHYIYGDFCNGKIWSITPDGNGGWTNVELLDEPGGEIASFGEDMHGELYMTKYSGGGIYKVDTEQCASFDIEVVGDVGAGTIDMTITGGSNNFEILWSNSETTEDLAGLTQGVYVVTVTDMGTACKRLYSVDLTEGEVVMTPTFMADGNTLTAADGYSSYQWYYNGILIDDITTQIYVVEFSGDYAVEGFNEEGCSALSAPQTITFVGLDDVNASIAVDVKPNPFDGKISLNIELKENTSISIKIHDLKGSIVYEEENILVNKSLVKELNLNDLPNGLYFLNIKTPKGEVTKRIVKD